MNFLELNISSNVVHTKFYLGVSLCLGLHKSCSLKSPLKLDLHNCEWPKNGNLGFVEQIFASFKALSHTICYNSGKFGAQHKSTWVSHYVSDCTNPELKLESHNCYSTFWDLPNKYLLQGIISPSVANISLVPTPPPIPCCIDADWSWHIGLLKLLLPQILLSCG